MSTVPIQIKTHSYEEFLATKFHFSQSHGFEIDKSEVHPLLHRHQPDLVQWMVGKGRAALFANFGLGKTLMQVEALRAIRRRVHGRQLVVAPLGVRQEFKRDAAKVDESVTFVRTTAEVAGDGLYLTNYESVRDGKIDLSLFNAASLDEASVLRSYGSETYQEFLPLFNDVEYRFVATATPSPNRYKELIHYAGFLGIMDTGQALTRFFQRDSTQANNLTLYPHMEAEFYAWLHSWATFIQMPSDLGYSDEGYALPEMRVHYHEVAVKNIGGKVDRDGQIQLVNDAALGLKDAAEEKRRSIDERIAELMGIVNGYVGSEESGEISDQIIIWCDLNDEQDAIEAALKARGLSYSSIYGSLSLDECEKRMLDWREKRTYALIGKAMMLGSGVNLQQCNKAIFAGITYKFNDMIQATHHIHRFLQERPCQTHIIYTETEREVLKELQRKWDEDTKLRARMSAIIRKYGLSTAGMEDELRRTIGVERRIERGECFEVANNDCCDETARMEENSVDLIHTSIPFGNHYEYSASYNDFGHNEDNAKFFDQMDYLTPQLLRILRPGRIAAIHVKDRIRFGNVTGYGMPSVDPFHSDCIVHYRKHGFIYMGMITVVTDVVRENNQTYRLGWSEQCKDGTKMGVGSPEYILLFRKLSTDQAKAYADVRVAKSKDDYTRAQWQVDAHAFWRSSGNRLVTSDDLADLPTEEINPAYQRSSLEHVYDYDEHVRIGKELDRRGALPATFMSLAPASHDVDVWHDVNRMRTLNGDQVQRNLTSHICPLQFDIVDRIIRRYTNEGEVVFDPFGGIMTVPYRAIKLGRYGRAAELSAEYFKDGVRYLREAELKRNAPTLFDALEKKEEVPA
jgi:DNA modification methylase